jgi:hypothetical protein
MTTPPAPLCSYCNRPVDITTAKTDEFGKAIHEDCYVLKAKAAAKLADLQL